MLEKDPGTPKIHRLRVIHLYEADYNLLLAVKWRQTLHHACSNNLINPSQYGSQPGKEATDALMLRELEYEMSRITRKACLHFDNDATSCYDRIPCALANIMSRKYGIHRKICIVQGKTLQDAKYHLKTKLGVSDEFIKHCQVYPIFGTGQGSGNSPAVWLFISSTLFDIYDKLATGSTYQTRERSLDLVVKAVGFVDDVRTSTNELRTMGLPSTAWLIWQRKIVKSGMIC
jgi:Reverse transcriptase (RNA-dependent DNA polymerase)